jgi:hypothetical protein
MKALDASNSEGMDDQVDNVVDMRILMTEEQLAG